MSDVHPYAAPSSRGRGRGRGRSQAVRAHVARLAQQRKAANGRRGRQKLYDHPKPQAASERLKELKAAFSTVANALRPALEDLGDRSLGQLKSSPQTFRDVDSFRDVQDFLDGRHRQVQATYDNRLELSTRLNNYIYNESRSITLDNFHRDCDDATDRFLDGQIRRLDLLEQLHDLGLPVNIVDNSWNFREISDEEFLDVKAHVEYRTGLGNHPIYGNKVEVPCARVFTGRRFTDPITAADWAAADNAKQSPKRKAEGEPDSQPAPKRQTSSTATDEGSSSSAPRHIGGLLSAVLPPTESEAEATPDQDSKVPSPSVAPVEVDEEMLEEDEAGTPADEEDAAATVQQVDDRLPPLPTGATEPDAYGVRLVNKRRTANLDVYNRIMVPSLFDFEPHEIGFRDSANDKSRGATKAKRGKYLGTPNSNTMHFDRSLWQFDATTYGEVDLDEEMVKKHGLHPKYGLFLRTSVNEPEPPRERKSGAHPIVFYTPGGRTLNASRSNKIARLEDEAAASAKKPGMMGALSQFMEQECIPESQVRATEEEIEAFRQEKLKLWLGPCRPRDETDEEEASTSDEDQRVDAGPSSHVDAQKQQQQQQQQQAIAKLNIVAANQSLGALLEAATTVEADERLLQQQQKQAALPPPPPRRSTSSRPFDPVRDVFMDNSPPEDHHRRPSISQQPSLADASSLLYMANLALDREYMSAYSQPQPARHIPRAPPLLQHQPQYPPPGEYAPRGMSMEPPPSYHHAAPPPPQQQQHTLDPRLFGGDAAAQPHEANNGYMTSSSGSYYQQQQSRSFLHTALNQTGPPPSHHAPPMAPQQDRYSIYGAPSHHHSLPPPPPPSAHVHGIPSMDAPAPMSSQYYMSPPPQQAPQVQQNQVQQQQQQQQQQSQHILPTLRQFSNGYAPSRMQAAPPPPHYQTGGPLVQSPQMYSAHMNGPPPPPPLPSTTHSHQLRRMSGSQAVNDRSGKTPPPGAVMGGEQGGNAVSNGKYRKLEPAPMATRRSSGWASGNAVDDNNSGGNTTSAASAGNSNNGGNSSGVQRSGSSSMGSGSGGSVTVTKELRTVPYDYEKIKDYAAVEPPPSHGPKAIRGWAHNNVRRSRGGTKHDLVAEWDKEEK